MLNILFITLAYDRWDVITQGLYDKSFGETGEYAKHDQQATLIDTGANRQNFGSAAARKLQWLK